tara:strand:- start:42 stop:230 length:189 start_codon:yes stop_codon:yes gene_type:complete
MGRGKIRTGNREGENSRYTPAFGIHHSNLGLFEKPVPLEIPVIRWVKGKKIEFSEVYTLKEK